MLFKVKDYNVGQISRSAGYVVAYKIKLVILINLCIVKVTEILTAFEKQNKKNSRLGKWISYPEYKPAT